VLALLPLEQAHVQGQARAGGQLPEEAGDDVVLEAGDPLAREVDVRDQQRALGDLERDRGERLVGRRDPGAVPARARGAQRRLERIAEEAWKQGIKATVYNCPEIRTNSSDIFVGVELSLFPLLKALKKEQGGAWAESQWQACRDVLQEEQTLESLLQKIDAYNASDVMKRFRDFAAWPMANSAELAEVMIGTSEEITKMHKSRDALVTDILSSLVLEGTGPLMFHESSNPAGPVLWLNHDIIAKQLNLMHN